MHRPAVTFRVYRGICGQVDRALLMDSRCEDEHNRASRSTGARYRERVNTQSSGPVRSPSGKKKGTTTTAQTHSMFRHAGSRKQRKTNWLREKQSSNEP